MANKKKLVVFSRDRSSLYSLRYEGGGEVPDTLKGEYTSQHEAIKARDRYIESKIPKPPRFPDIPIRPNTTPVPKETKVA